MASSEFNAHDYIYSHCGCSLWEINIENSLSGANLVC